MKLEIGNFHVEDIVFGEKTEFAQGILTINKKEALDFVLEDKHIIEADLFIVKPGDNVRLMPVKEAIEPRVKLNGDSLFPGYTGDLVKAGNGRTHALKDCSLLVVGKHWGGFQDGLIDMSGEGAKYTYYSQLKNIVLVADTDEEFEFNTTSAWVIDVLDRIPLVGDSFDYKNMHIEVTDADSKKVNEIKITFLEETQEDK